MLIAVEFDNPRSLSGPLEHFVDRTTFLSRHLVGKIEPSQLVVDSPNQRPAVATLASRRSMQPLGRWEFVSGLDGAYEFHNCDLRPDRTSDHKNSPGR